MPRHPTGGRAGDDDAGEVLDVDELEAELGGGRNVVDLASSYRTSATAGGRNRRGWVTFTRSFPPGPCAIYCARVTLKVLLEGVTARSSAAIVGTDPGIETNADANIGQFLPTAYRLPFTDS